MLPGQAGRITISLGGCPVDTPFASGRLLVAGDVMLSTMPGRSSRRLPAVVASPWFWPPAGIAAVAVAGWVSSGPSVPLAVALLLVVLVAGFGAGLYVASDRDEQANAEPTEQEPPRKPGGKRVSLRGANLRNADLRGADLSGADMEGADLRGANLAPLTDDPQ
jgi:hypothetical protein